MLYCLLERCNDTVAVDLIAGIGQLFLCVPNGTLYNLGVSRASNFLP